LRFCSRCGRDETSIPIIRHLCVNCYIEYYGSELISRSIHLVQCPSCGSYRLGDRWVSPADVGGDERIVVAYILEEGLRLPEGFDAAEVEDLRIFGTEYGEVVEARLRISIRGKVYTLSRRASLLRERRLCPLCHRARGKGYEAVLQIRGHPAMGEDLRRRVGEIIGSMPEALRSLIAEIEESRYGVELKLLSRHAAQAIANAIRRELGGVIKISEEGEVRGRAGGRRKPRLVVSLRIADLREGMYIRVGGAPYIVEEVLGDSVVLRDREGRRVSMGVEEILRDRG